jgi:hypothetical protein
MTPMKKARKQQELDALVFSVLVSYRQQGPIQWTDWHQATSTKRGGKRGLATYTFSNAVKRLVANGRVRKDKNGCYEGVYSGVGDAEGSHSAANPHDVEPANLGKRPIKQKLKRYAPRTSA